MLPESRAVEVSVWFGCVFCLPDKSQLLHLSTRTACFRFLRTRRSPWNCTPGIAGQASNSDGSVRTSSVQCRPTMILSTQQVAERTAFLREVFSTTAKFWSIWRVSSCGTYQFRPDAASTRPVSPKPIPRRRIRNFAGLASHFEPPECLARLLRSLSRPF